MLSPLEIGGRLWTAREQCDISQEEAANALALPPADLIELESGHRAVSTLEITKLAELYHYPVTFFLSADRELSGDDPLVVLHQELSKLKSMPEVRDALWRLFDLYGEITVLQGMLGRPPQATLPDYRDSMEGELGHVCEKAEFAAREERDRLALENKPVPGDVAGIISDQGIWVASIGFPDFLSGLFVNQDFGPAILVNQNHSPERRRFSYLHEFAHVLFDRSDKAAMMTRRQATCNDPREMRANRFAAAFLMPPEGVAEKLDTIRKSFRNPRLESPAVTYENVAVLAHHFGVSYAAMVVRLNELSYINSNEQADLFKKTQHGRKAIERLGRPKLSQNPLSSKISEQKLCNQLKNLAIEAFRQEEISPGRLAEIGKKLGIDRDDLLELAQA